MNEPKTPASVPPIPAQGYNPALDTRNDSGARITRCPAALTPAGNPVGFYPYNTYVRSNAPAPRKPGEVKPEYKSADLSKLKPATAEKHETPVAMVPAAPAAPTVAAPAAAPAASASSRPWARK